MSKTQSAMIRLVTFDLDNTLWSVDDVIRRAESKMNEWLEAWGHKRVPREDVAVIYRRIVEEDPAIVHDISELRERMLRAELQHCGRSSEEAANLAAGAFAEFLDWRHRVTLFPHALDVLGALRERYTLAALTNGNADYRRLGLDRFFAFGYCAADVRASKPDTAMFKRALAHAQVAPAEAVHVGDHLEHDIRAASEAGMATIWVNLPASSGAVPASSGDEDGSVEADATVTSLADLPAVVAALHG